MKRKETCPICGSKDIDSRVQFDENDDPAGLAHQCRECGHIYNTEETLGDFEESPDAPSGLASPFPPGRKSMQELREDFRSGGFADTEMAKRQAVVKEHAERQGLTRHKGTALTRGRAEPEGLPTAFTVGVGSEIRIGGVPHILVAPGPGAGLWITTEGETVDVAGAAQDDSLDYAAHRENPHDAEAKEVYDRESSAEAMHKLSARLDDLPSLGGEKTPAPRRALSGFIRKPGTRLPLLKPVKKDRI